MDTKPKKQQLVPTLGTKRGDLILFILPSDRKLLATYAVYVGEIFSKIDKERDKMSLLVAIAIQLEHNSITV